MADLSHLEKMGRELKCPICLSLLKSAAALACNHVFCNSCILESMRAASDCPICKVPFRRREVRAAPHMDNLVSVYKSMEAALGVNIFTTQVAPSTKSSEEQPVQVDGKKFAAPETKMVHSKAGTITDSQKGSAAAGTKMVHSEEGIIPDDSHNNSAAPETKILRGRKSKRKTSSKQQKEADVRSFGKKRVLVTPYPVSETPLRPEKISKSEPSNSVPKISNIEPEENRVSNQQKLQVTREQGDPMFTPFFWLREDNGDEGPEKLSTQRTEDESPPKTVPCFSDIKDSDDDTDSIKMTPPSKPVASEVFDSEMFEWTQRACSPELCLTPLKKQTSGKHNLERTAEEDAHQNPGTTEVAYANKEVEARRKVAARKGSDKKKRSKKKNVEKITSRSSSSSGSLIEVLPEVLHDYGEAPKDPNQEKEGNEHKKLGNRGTNGNKRGNKSTSHYSRKHVKDPIGQLNENASTTASERLPASSVIAEKQNQDIRGAGTELYVLLHCEASNVVAPDMKNKRTGDDMITLQTKRKHRKTSTNDIIANKMEIPSNSVNEKGIKEQKYQETNSSNCVLSGNHGDDNERSCSGKRSDESRKQRANKPTTGCQDNEIPSYFQKSDSLATTKTKSFCSLTKDNILRKCNNINSQVICAFCQSSDDTKVSGEMMHYFDGKPVAPDFNGGINVIHSHKNCTEWAPDVYFEDELAVNLSTELARSRRIRCNCCGMKGAALGCYEKSCRKSFHYTCAKLSPECRWGNDHFVMLCPLHSSSKLPNETPMAVRQHRKKSARKVEPQAAFISKPCNDASQKWSWPSGSPCKWVLCCSSLTVAEKEIVSEFIRLAGVSISKTWIPSITHVIASTDENGACRRTLKFLKGILNGKWILSIEWIKACREAMAPVDEEKYEISLDIHGTGGGPRLGRMRIINKQPKLFDGFEFYFTGDFQPSYKGYLQDLVTAAGGTVLQRKPILRDQEMLLDDSPASTTFIIYNLEVAEKHKRIQDAATIFDQRKAEAQALAYACGARVAGNSWVLDSIAACKLQPLA